MAALGSFLFRHLTHLPLTHCVRGLKYVLALVCPCRVISGPGACDVSYDVSDYRLLLPGSSRSSTPNVFLLLLLLARETIKTISLHLTLFAALSRRRPYFLRETMEKARIEAGKGKCRIESEWRLWIKFWRRRRQQYYPSSCVGGYTRDVSSL